MCINVSSFLYQHFCNVQVTILATNDKRCTSVLNKKNKYNVFFSFYWRQIFQLTMLRESTTAPCFNNIFATSRNPPCAEKNKAVVPVLTMKKRRVNGRRCTWQKSVRYCISFSWTKSWKFFSKLKCFANEAKVSTRIETEQVRT